MQTSVILEAEIVPYNEASREGGRGPGIEEFWHLGSAGINAESAELERVTLGDRYRNQHRHLGLVFFDILHLDGENLLPRTYDERLKLLEGTVRVVPGFVSPYVFLNGLEADGSVNAGRACSYTVVEGDDRRPECGSTPWDFVNERP